MPLQIRDCPVASSRYTVSEKLIYETEYDGSSCDEIACR